MAYKSRSARRNAGYGNEEADALREAQRLGGFSDSYELDDDYEDEYDDDDDFSDDEDFDNDSDFDLDEEFNCAHLKIEDDSPRYRAADPNEVHMDNLYPPETGEILKHRPPDSYGSPWNDDLKVIL